MRISEILTNLQDVQKNFGDVEVILEFGHIETPLEYFSIRGGKERIDKLFLS